MIKLLIAESRLDYVADEGDEPAPACQAVANWRRLTISDFMAIEKSIANLANFVCFELARRSPQGCRLEIASPSSLDFARDDTSSGS